MVQVLVNCELPEWCPGPGALCVYIGGPKCFGYSTSSLTDGWHHIKTVAFNGATTLLVDGEKVSTIPPVSQPRLWTVGGARVNSWRPFHGTIAGLIVYDIASTQTGVPSH
eukprot:COSAG06_NODE_26464_length_614_cov_1.015534_1_plen_109_part_01